MPFREVGWSMFVVIMVVRGGTFNMPLTVCPVFGGFSTATGTVVTTFNTMRSSGRCVSGGSQTIGAGGSSSSCTKKIAEPLFFVPMTEAYQSITTLSLAVKFTDIRGTGMSLNLVGLGLRSSLNDLRQGLIL